MYNNGYEDKTKHQTAHLRYLEEQWEFAPVPGKVGGRSAVDAGAEEGYRGVKPLLSELGLHMW